MNTYSGRFDASVEIGHMYAPDLLTPFTGLWRTEDTAELPVFEPPTRAQKQWKEIAQKYSDRPLILSLIDDIEVADERDALFTDLSVIEALSPHDVCRESDYKDAAKELVERMRHLDLPKGYRLSQDRSKL